MNANEAPKKKPYQKPELKVIEVKEEEVLAIGCKTIGPTSNVGFSNCGTGNGCNSAGS
jgi:hypothetical protein